MIFSALTLRKRIFLAVAAIVVVHAAFYVTPRVIATRARFDEAAWKEAVDILKENVGAAAVEKGVFTIRKAKVAAPYRGEVIVVGGHDGMFLTLGENCFVLWTRSGATAFAEERSALSGRWLVRSEARHLWTVLRYISLVECRPAAGALPYASSDTALMLVDRTWPCSNTAAFDERHQTGLGHNVALGCSRTVFERFKVAPSGEPAGKDEVKRAANDSIGVAMPPHGEAAVRWAHGVAMLVASDPSLDALPALRQIARAHRGSWLRRNFADDLRHVRLLRGLLGAEPYKLPDVTPEAGFLETIVRVPEAERFTAAIGLAFGGSDPRRVRIALHYLAAVRSWEVVDLCLARWDGAGGTQRSLLLEDYGRFFGNDERVARKAAESQNAAERAYAFFHLYRLTRDERHLDALLEIAASENNRARADVDYLLQRVYQADRGNAKVREFLLRHPSSRPDVPLDAGLLADLVADPDRAVAVLGGTRQGLAGRRSLMAFQLIGCREPAVVSRIVGYIKAGPPAEDAADDIMQQYILRILGASANGEALSFVEEALAKIYTDSAGGLAAWRDKDLTKTCLSRAAFELSVELGDSPFAAADDTIFPLVRGWDREWAFSGALARRYTTAELQALLADDASAPYLSIVYQALDLHRTRHISDLQWRWPPEEQAPPAATPGPSGPSP